MIPVSGVEILSSRPLALSLCYDYPITKIRYAPNTAIEQSVRLCGSNLGYLLTELTDDVPIRYHVALIFIIWFVNCI